VWSTKADALAVTRPDDPLPMRGGLREMTAGEVADRPVLPGARSGSPHRNRSFRRYSFDAAAAQCGHGRKNVEGPE
jgi:hypothetical protein